MFPKAGAAARDGYTPLLPMENTPRQDGLVSRGELSPARGELLLRLMEQPDSALFELLRRLADARPGVLQRAVKAAETRAADPAEMRDSALLLSTPHPSRDPEAPRAELATQSRDDSRDLSPSDQAHVPIVQFSSFTYYCHEHEGAMALDIMRLGDCTGPSEVSFQTRDKSAKAGEHYASTTSRVFFEPGETTAVVEVPLCESEEWDTTVEFAAELHAGEKGLQNAVLGRYLWASRVKVIDNDCFPSNKYSEYILSGRIGEAPKIGLFLEYLKFNWANPTVRSRTRWYMVIHQVHNLYGFTQLFLNVYLVDYVLNPEHDVAKLWLVQSREKSLILIIALLVMPFFILHVLDHILVTRCGVGGTSRMRLQAALIRKFLNYDAGVRLRIRNGEVIMGITRDSTALVSNGYKGVVCLVREAGQLALMLIYQLVAPIVFDKPFSWLGFVPLVMFPVTMGIFLRCRDRQTAELLTHQSTMQTELIEAVEETVVNYRLIADYGQREKSVSNFEKVVNDFNSSNRAMSTALLQSSYFAKWLAVICVTGWTLFGGLQVCEGHQTLGMFLANVSIFHKIGVGWGSIYGLLIQISTTFPALANLITALNLPTDVALRKLVNRKIRVECANVRDQMRKSLTKDNPDVVVVDFIPIAIGNLKFKYMTKGPSGGTRVTVLNQKGLFKIQQGRLVCLVGPQGGGKSTLLKLIGGEMLPDPDDVSANAGPEDGQFCVPSHLRVFHVTGPLFFEGTIKDNLLFGVAPDDDDGRLERVERICRKLGMDEEVVKQTESNEEHVWSDVLSSTQCQLLSIASALIANPEVLCIHKPTQTFDGPTATKVTEVFKEFVERRGIAAGAPASTRRPRTCIMTTSDRHNLGFADAVYNVSRENGIEQLDERDWKTAVNARASVGSQDWKTAVNA